MLYEPLRYDTGFLSVKGWIFLNLYTLFISNQASYNVFTEPEVEK